MCSSVTTFFTSKGKRESRRQERGVNTVRRRDEGKKMLTRFPSSRLSLRMILKKRITVAGEFLFGRKLQEAMDVCC